MGGWLRYLVLKAQVRAGVSADIAVWAAVAALAAVAGVVFLLTAAFIWLAERYGGVTAALVLGGFFILVALAAAIACVLIRRSNMERARLELAARNSGAAGWMDPKLLTMGLQVGKAIGWRKLASLGAVALLAAILAREWLGRGAANSQSEDESE
jgi:hypothetical protein